MIIPIINKFTCTPSQLNLMIKLINKKNINVILDYANENFENHLKTYKQIKNLIEKYPKNHISLKLSSFNVQNNKEKAEEYAFNLIDLAKKNNSKILIDAENYLIQDKINTITNNALEYFNKEEVIVYKTYQMYRKDSLDILKNDILKSKNYFIGCKLVRGAYYNQDYKYNILYDKIELTHKNYNNAILFLSNNKKKKDIIMCATHNEDSINLAKKLSDKFDLEIEFAQLLGMSDGISEELSKNYRVFKYLPYGNFNDTLPYLIRRLYENYPMLINIFK